MKLKAFVKSDPFLLILISFSFILSGITFFYSKKAAAAELICAVIIMIASFIRYSDSVKRKKVYLRKLDDSLSQSGENLNRLSSFPFPSLLCAADGSIVWFNAAFDAVIADFPEAKGSVVGEYTGGKSDFLTTSSLSPFEIKGIGRSYSVYPSKLDDALYVLYFVDDTPLKLIREKYNISRPAVLLMSIDSLEQTEDTLSHADYYSVVSDIDRMVTKWFVKYNCIFRKFSDGKFVAVTQLSDLDAMISDRFSLLDDVRGYRCAGAEVDITLSVGIGKGEYFSDCEQNARQAIDMARGRGGDQVALKSGDSYEFFGGITNKKEKRGKVKSRIVAATLNDYIENSSSVYITGHTFSDFDCVGAAVGIAAIARACGKTAYIVINRNKSLAIPLISMLENAGIGSAFISEEKAAETINDNSVVVITDTMRESLVDAPSLLTKKCRRIVIDHHRMTVDHIQNAALMFHEPYASSTCEMVTELVQYSPSKPRLTQAEAQAILSGMILDTKDFSLRVGVRTFEAAAFLRDCKADTAAVKKLFAGSIDDNINVGKVIAGAELYNNFCIAVANIDCSNLRLICSKAADELLKIENVDASFVISTLENTVNISARSWGKINVQLIMEKLGGGGHQSMAACQITECTAAEAVEKLKAAITEYNTENT